MASASPCARTVTTDVLTYLNGDHLGSASLVTDAQGGVVSEMRYYPYGETRSSTLPTDYQFTGQRWEDGIGLYDYNARYYDPTLGRFVSADSIVPGAASGAGGGAATLGYDPKTRLTPLTVNLGEFAEQINAENRELLQFGWFFQWNARTRREHNIPSGPVNPQALNRYAYVLNNPLRYVDPTGHDQITEGTFTIEQLKNLKTLIEDMKTTIKYAGHISDGGSILLGASTGLGAELGLLAAAVWEVEIHFETSQLESLSNFIGRVIETAEEHGVETVTISTSYDPFFTCEVWWSGIGVTISATDGQGRSLYDRWVLTGMTGLYVPLLISNPERTATLLKKLHSTAVTWE